MILGRPFFAPANLLVETTQGEVIIRLNNQYQAYKAKTPKEEDYNDTNCFVVWFSFGELVERYAEEEPAAELAIEEWENLTTEDYDHVVWTEDEDPEAIGAPDTTYTYPPDLLCKTSAEWDGTH